MSVSETRNLKEGSGLKKVLMFNIVYAEFEAPSR